MRGPRENGSFRFTFPTHTFPTDSITTRTAATSSSRPSIPVATRRIAGAISSGRTPTARITASPPSRASKTRRWVTESNVTFTPRSIGDGIQGYWNQGYQSDSSLQSTFVFKIGSCVMGLYVDASEATPKRGNRRFARPSEDEVLQTYRQFHAAFGRYIADRGWTNLETSRTKPDFDRKTPPPGDVSNDSGQPPSETETASEPPGPADQTESGLTPAEIAAVSAIAGGAALLGSLTDARRDRRAARGGAAGDPRSPARARAGGPVRGVEAEVRGAGLEVQREERRCDLRSGGRRPQ